MGIQLHTIEEKERNELFLDELMKALKDDLKNNNQIEATVFRGMKELNDDFMKIKSWDSRQCTIAFSIPKGDVVLKEGARIQGVMGSAARLRRAIEKAPLRGTAWFKFQAFPAVPLGNLFYSLTIRLPIGSLL